MRLLEFTPSATIDKYAVEVVGPDMLVALLPKDLSAHDALQVLRVVDIFLGRWSYSTTS